MGPLSKSVMGVFLKGKKKEGRREMERDKASKKKKSQRREERKNGGMKRRKAEGGRKGGNHSRVKREGLAKLSDD